MGLWSWLFPGPAQRVARARALLARGDPAEARLEAMDLDLPEARQIVAEAERALAVRNLEAAVSWADAGDDARATEHMALAERFGATGDDLRAARASIREVRGARDAEAARQRAERDARLMQIDPLGLSGGPSLLAPAGSDDLDAEDAVERQARLDLLVASYPDALRGALADLPPTFARAVLDLDDGRPDLALQDLLSLPDDVPIVLWERVRAANFLGDGAAAIRTLRRFAEVAGGHHVIGQHHTGVFLAQLLAEHGDPAAGLRVLRDVRASEPHAGGFLFAQLLAVTGGLPEAETVLRELIRRDARFLPAYALLAEVRLRGGHRVEAMTALERAMDQTCATGRCGTCAPDLGITRRLATLYLESGLEPVRALELSRDARAMVSQPVWDDLYLAALTAKATGSVDAPVLGRRAWELASEDRRAAVEQYLDLGT